MMHFSNKWKIFSIGLTVILVTGFVAPQAYADVTSTILSVVRSIQSQVNDPSYGLKAQATKAVILNNETGHEQVWLPPVKGVTYSGHLTANTVDYPICKQPGQFCFPDPVMFICVLPGATVHSVSTTAIQPLQGSTIIQGQANYNTDFSCKALYEDGVSSTTGIYGIIHYTAVRG